MGVLMQTPYAQIKHSNPECVCLVGDGSNVKVKITNSIPLRLKLSLLLSKEMKKIILKKRVLIVISARSSQSKNGL